MNRRLASLALCACLLATGCQQAVRPNLASADPPMSVSASPQVPIAEPEPATKNAAPSSTAKLISTDAVLAAAANSSPAPGRGEDVFARIRRGLSPDACLAGSNSDRWRHRYAGNPDAFASHVERILPLLDFVSIEVERTGLPTEFVFIPLVESWYRPEAVGPGGPAGMWQMISSTARNHGIHIQPGYDGRLSPVESTRAALSYLKTLQGMFDGWQAIVMAYNAGEGRMMGAFRRSQNRDVSAARRKPHGLSNITYDYVAKLQALSCLIAEPDKQGLRLPMAAQFVPLRPVLMDADIRTLDQLAHRQGRDASQLRQLNPGYKNGRVVPGVPRLALLPSTPLQVETATTELLAEEIVPTPELAPNASAVGNTAAASHEVQSGDSLWSIAKRHNLSIDQLRDINRLSPGEILHPGQLLKLAP